MIIIDKIILLYTNNSILHFYAVKLQMLYSQNNYFALGMCIQTYSYNINLFCFIELNYVNSKIER